MDVLESRLPGVKTIKPRPNVDSRGFFVRVSSADLLAAAGIEVASFVQENQSRSRRGTLRGLHFRVPGESKTVRCASGRAFYVVVDLRPGSPMFLEWESFILDDESHRQVFVPPGCANGFQALSETVDMCYRHDHYYEPGCDRAVAWDDPDLGIPWPLADPILSDRDREAPGVEELKECLYEWFEKAPL